MTPASGAIDAAPPSGTRPTLSSGELSAWSPYALSSDGVSALAQARERMRDAGQWAPWQMLGRRMAVGCVALEITQRCNLDCAYCYLSESSEALHDIPLAEVFRRIDLIFDFYGAGTDVQITGGDPTLRRRDELAAIVRYVKQKGLRASLFTNGIRLNRAWLAELCAAGLEDVAFHVDTTQRRTGYASEAALNALRLEYIERARGLPVSVFFNTTVCAGNLDEVPALVRFFIAHAEVVRLASFQLGADTGRGVERRHAVTVDAVKDAIRHGAGTPLDFSAASAGHADCNGYAYGLIVNGRMHDFFNDARFVHRVLEASAAVALDRANTRRTRRRVLTFLAARPRILFGAARRFATLVWKQRRDFIAARGKVRKLSFFVHDFMDAQALDRQRCEACAFMVMTPEGPLSMCVHNAKRDDYLLVPARVERGSRVMFFHPGSGRLHARAPDKIDVALTRKTARGRAALAEASR